MRSIHKLTDVQLRKVEKGKPKSLSDGAGLYFDVTKTNQRFRFRYQRPFTKKINNLVIGSYPALNLKRARDIAQQYREMLSLGQDPAQFKGNVDMISFGSMAESYFQRMKPEWSFRHNKTTRQRYNKHIKDVFGQMPAENITARDIYSLLERVAQRGSYQTSEKLSHIISSVFNHGIALGTVTSNPAVGIFKVVSKTSSEEPMAHFNLTKKGEKERFAKFLQDIRSIKNLSHSVRAALLLAPHLFLRTGNLISLRLEHFNEDERLLVIPASEMKSGHTEFLIPLSHQAIAIIKQQLEDKPPKENPPRDFIFNAKGKASSRQVSISNKGLNNAKSRAGWSNKDVTLHGLRHTAATYLTEAGYDYEVVELQLHHKLVGVRGIYNKAVHLERRREMMQHWSDFIDELLSIDLTAQKKEL